MPRNPTLHAAQRRLARMKTERDVLRALLLGLGVLGMAAAGAVLSLKRAPSPTDNLTQASAPSIEQLADPGRLATQRELARLRVRILAKRQQAVNETPQRPQRETIPASRATEQVDSESRKHAERLEQALGTARAARRMAEREHERAERLATQLAQRPSPGAAAPQVARQSPVFVGPPAPEAAARFTKRQVTVLGPERLATVTKTLEDAIENYAAPKAVSLQPELSTIAQQPSLEAAESLWQLLDKTEQLLAQLGDDREHVDKRLGRYERGAQLAKARRMAPARRERRQRELEVLAKKSELRQGHQKRLGTVRTQLLEALPLHVADTQTAFYACKLREAKDNRVLSTILASLENAEATHTVDQVIKSLGGKKDRRELICRTLRALTGAELKSTKRTAWQGWWRKQNQPARGKPA